MRPSRREFVKWVTASGIALSLSRLASAEEPDFDARETLPGRQSWNPAATGAGRIDGVAKVTGAKLYASDFRAADLPGLAGEDVARHARPRARRDARLYRHGPRALERRARSRRWWSPPPISRAPAPAFPNSTPATCSARSARRRSISASRWRC